MVHCDVSQLYQRYKNEFGQNIGIINAAHIQKEGLLKEHININSIHEQSVDGYLLPHFNNKTAVP
jgi:hypothetical protein